MDQITTLRLFKKFINSAHNYLSVFEISSEDLRIIFSFTDIKERKLNKIKKLPEIRVFTLPNLYQISGLSIFDSEFQSNQEQ